MNLTCDIAQDLLPLYKDGIASPDSANAVRAHLRECKNCRDLYRRAMLEDMKRTVFIKNRKTNCPEDISEQYRQLSGRLQRKYVVRKVVMASVVAASVTFAAASLFLKKR